MFSHTECHLSATQQCNSTLITTITKILQKLFLNLMHCSQYTSHFFSTGKGHYFTDTVALFGKKQKLNHMTSVTTDKQEPM